MNKLYCTQCPDYCLITIMGSGLTLVVEGNKCPKGRELVDNELSDPVRTLTATVRTNFPDVPVISVRTDGVIAKSQITNALSEINEIVVNTELACGDVLIEDVAKTGVKVIVTSPALMQLGAELENNNDRLSSTGASSRERRSDGSSDGDADSSGNVRSSLTGTAIDDIGTDSVGGFVGAAGEAVGVEGASGDDAGEDGKDESNEAENARSKDYIKHRGRPHIR